MISTAVLKVKGMNCMHCKANVERLLMQMDGIQEAVVNLDRAEVSVTFNKTRVQLEEIKDEIEDIGYEVEA